MCGDRFSRVCKILSFAQRVGRSRPFSGRFLLLAEGRPMPHRRHLASAQRELTAAIRSSTRCSSFDNAESRLTTYERHVEGYHRLGNPLQRECAHLFCCDISCERGVDALTEQNLTVLGLSTKTGGDIAHCTDRGVAGALREPRSGPASRDLRTGRASVNAPSPIHTPR